MLRKSALFGMIVFGGMACGGDVEPVGSGSVALEWDVRPRGCVAAGVDTVSVQLSGTERVIESFPCADGAGEVEGLAPGGYELSIFGLDSRNKRTFWVEPSNVRVRSDRVTDLEDVELTARPAEVEVFWTFSNGRVCGANGVDDVEVVVFDKLDYEVGRETFACDDGLAPMTGFPAGTYIFEVTAEVAETQAWYGVETITVDRGEDAQIEVSLDHL